jgi:hypothetical protein
MNSISMLRIACLIVFCAFLIGAYIYDEQHQSIDNTAAEKLALCSFDRDSMLYHKPYDYESYTPPTPIDPTNPPIIDAFLPYYRPREHMFSKRPGQWVIIVRDYAHSGNERRLSRIYDNYEGCLDIARYEVPHPSLGWDISCAGLSNVMDRNVEFACPSASRKTGQRN